MTDDAIRCHCGQPLHYSNLELMAAVEALCVELGPDIDVTVGDFTYAVPRHYIALHGIKAWELPHLGFPKRAA